MNPILRNILLRNRYHAAAGGGGGAPPASDLPSSLDVYFRGEDLGLADSDPVSSWTDFYGATTVEHVTNQPNYVALALNGLPGVGFTAGSNDRLVGTGLSAVQSVAGMTFYLVASMPAASVNEQNVVEFHDVPANQRPGFSIRRLGSGAGSVINVFFTNVAGIINFVTAVAWTSSFKLLSGVWRPDGSAQIWDRGVSIASQAATAGDEPADLPMSTLHFGTRNQVDDYWGGVLLTFGYVSVAHNDTTRVAMQDALIAKYAL